MSKNIPFHYVDLALRFMEGHSTPQESAELDQWIRQDARHLELFEEIKLNWLSGPQPTSGAIEAFADLARRLGLPENPDQHQETTQGSCSSPGPQQPVPDPEASVRTVSHPARVRHSRIFGLAASLAGVLALAAGAWYFLSHDNGRTYHTGYAEVRTFLLPDSSMVTLNANSTLTIGENWMEQPDRRVSLEGEAFFEVSKQRQGSPEAQTFRKFIVSTGNLEVVVLGTTFNVNYRDDETSVALNSGSIRLKLRKNAREILMQPGDMVEVTPLAEPVIRKGVAVANYSSWKTGQLFLDGSTLQEIKNLLQHNYGLSIEFEAPESLKDVRLRGKFPSDDPALLLKAIADVTGTVRKEENGRIHYLQKAKTK